MISKDEVRKYLGIVYDLKRECAFYDVHAHPFEIFYNEVQYARHPSDERLYASDGTDFAGPAISDVMADTDERSRSVLRLIRQSSGSREKLSAAFRHTGPRIFEQHALLSGIDHVLLLPAWPPDGASDAQMAQTARMFVDENLFLLAGSIPRTVKIADIATYMQDAADRFCLRAVKLHPNLTGINPVDASGRERIEAILDACGNCGLPLMVHGGMSPVLKDSPAATYGILENLSRIDWGAGRVPVIIAHAGFYGYEFESVDKGRLSALRRLLDRCGQAWVDLSGLNVGVMSKVLENIGSHRILFGSDMLYEDQWQMVVRTMYAIDRSGLPLEENFIRIAGRNPAAIFADK